MIIDFNLTSPPPWVFIASNRMAAWFPCPAKKKPRGAAEGRGRKR